MTNFQDLKKRMLKNPKVKKYYEELGPEYAMIEAKIRKQIKERAKRQRTNFKISIS